MKGNLLASLTNDVRLQTTRENLIYDAIAPIDGIILLRLNRLLFIRSSAHKQKALIQSPFLWSLKAKVFFTCSVGEAHLKWQ